MRTDAVLRVETPEYVVFDFELAGLASRALAWAVDAVAITVLVVLVYTVASFAALLAGDLAVAFAMVAAFLVQWGYFTVFEWAWRGQTPGKRAVGLRVLQETGVRPAFHQTLIRNLLRIVDSLPLTYLVGGATALGGERRQRFGDVIAGTVVVRERRRPLPSVVVPQGERYNTFLEDRRAMAAARRAVDPQLRELMTSLALRREEIELEARLELFRRLADHLVELGVPRPRALSDERFVLGATAAVLGIGAEAR